MAIDRAATRALVHRLLSFLGRHARWALPAGVFVGIVLPGLAASLRPLLTAAVIGTLASALLRLNWSHLAEAARRPALPAALAAWQLVGSPVAVGAVTWALGVPHELAQSLLLQAAAPPIGSTAVFALILGLDGILSVVATVSTTLLLPVTLTTLVALLPDSALRVDLLAFFARVLLLVALPFAIAWAIRAAVSPARLARHDAVLGGLNVVLLVIFAIAVMDGVTAKLLRDPGAIGTLLLAACVMGAVLHLAGYALFARRGLATAYTAALLSGNRNMGLMLVITAGTAGETFSLYVGIAQIPMYFAPLLLSPFLRRSRIAAAARGG